MTDLGGLGRLLVALGIVLVAVGIGLAWGPRIPWFGRLPGDLTFSVGPTRVYLPLATCLVISLVLTLLMRLLTRR